MDLPKLRAFWFERLGLSGRLNDAKPCDVLSQTGWARSVGGANPYLTLFARAGTSRESADSAAANLEIHELPSLRGCTYVVPADDFGLALRLARGEGDPQDVGVAKRHLGVSEAELFNLQQKVLDCLGSEPVDPKEIKDRVGDAVRSLGEEGKKRGMQTTLPMCLGMLQTAGLIRRVPVSGRLDQQRFKYVKWENPPVQDQSLEEAQLAFAKRYFDWLGIASRAAFKNVAGLGVKRTDAILNELRLSPLEAGSDYFGTMQTIEAFRSFQIPRDPQIRLVSNLDGISHLNWGIAPLIDEADHTQSAFGPKGLMNLGGLSDLENHPILDRGRLIGLWEFDPEMGEIAHCAFQNQDVSKEVESTAAFIRDHLSDFRSFSLDSPETRKPRIEFLRAAKG